MAFTPCAYHGALYHGGASTFFLRLVDGISSVGGKLQVCASCADTVLDWLDDHAVKVSEGETFLEHTDPLACGNCGGDVSGGHRTLYGNAYPRGHHESQWYAKVCPSCTDEVAEVLHLDAAVSRR